MRKSNQTSLKEAIEELLKAYKLNTKIDEVKLRNIWSEITGHFIAKETEKVELKGKVLQIKIKNPIIRQELNFARTKLIDKINQRIGKNLVEEILFF